MMDVKPWRYEGFSHHRQGWTVHDQHRAVAVCCDEYTARAIAELSEVIAARIAQLRDEDATNHARLAQNRGLP